MNSKFEIEDDVIEKIRSIREAYAERFNYDITSLFRHACDRVKNSEWKIVKRRPKPVEKIEEIP
jgi:hypothetical protein